MLLVLPLLCGEKWWDSFAQTPLKCVASSEPQIMTSLPALLDAARACWGSLFAF